MTTAKQLKTAREEAIARLRYDGQAAPLEEKIDEVMADVLNEWETEAAQDRAMYGNHEDTPCLQDFHCDDYADQLRARWRGRV